MVTLTIRSGKPKNSKKFYVSTKLFIVIVHWGALNGGRLFVTFLLFHAMYVPSFRTFISYLSSSV